ncbi:MAG: hypothetical protein J1F01_06250 [Oscillospiraceae bacterium]|nr:hypothetical protein [Oscillospiraceae bacterium]
MKKILCFGDSNTWGHDPVDCSQLQRPWPVVLRELLPEYEIVSDGRCGRATKFDVPNMPDTNGIEKFRERYLTEDNHFDLIIIMLGTNDLLNHFDCSPEETAETLSAYVRECRERFKDQTPRILLMSPIEVKEDVTRNPIFKDQYDISAVDKSKRFKEAISAVAMREGTFFLAAADFAEASVIDGVHMEPEEHKKLAAAVADKIRTIFGSR